MDTEEIRDKTDSKQYDVKVEELLHKKLGTDPNYRHKYIWQLVAGHAALQISWFIGLYTVIFHAKLATFIWAIFVGTFAGQGITLGSHRLFTHKAFKVTKPLKILIVVLQTMAGQNSIFRWVRDHKLHHAYSDTDADPHNSNKGFFFSHMGWLMVKKHPLVMEKQKQIDVSELLADKMIMFQYKYFFYLYFVLAVVFPVSVPMYFWNETLWSSFFVAYCLQYVTILHVTWNTNSFAHFSGPKPYDKRIQATHSIVYWLAAFGDGWHNFHHAFPWDYRMAEFGKLYGMSVYMLDFLAYIGLAYDLKAASPNVVHAHMKRYGDETGQKMLAEKEKSQNAEKNILEIICEKLDCM